MKVFGFVRCLDGNLNAMLMLTSETGLRAIKVILYIKLLVMRVS